MKHDKALETALSPILKGKSIKDWIEYTASTYAKPKPNRSNETDLKKILQRRNVNKFIFEDISHGGGLNITKDGFELILSRYLKDKEQELRFIIAHELAHTFFYDIEVSPPKHLIYLKQGEKDLEDICNSMARAVLMPLEKINHELNQFELVSSDIHSRNKNLLPFLFSLSRSFNVQLITLYERLFNDCKLFPKTIVLEYNIALKNKGNIDFENCTLKNAFTGYSLRNEELYIPYPKRGRKAASLREYFCQIVEKAYASRKSTNFLTHKLLVKDILESKKGLGNLKEKISKKITNAALLELTVHTFVTEYKKKNPETNEWYTYYPTVLINLPIFDF